VLKELPSFRRGREPGEVRALLRKALIDRGFPSDGIDEAETETDAVERALAWARPGDLLVLLVHDERPQVLELLHRAGAKAPAA
jgi:cyanophycin synthetase